MEVHYQRAFADYEELLATQQARTLGHKIGSTVLWCGIYIVGSAGLVALGVPQGRAMMAIAAVTVIPLLILAAIRPHRLRRDFLRHPNFARAERAQIDEAGLRVESEVGSSNTNWAAYIQWHETQNLFLLYLGARSVQVIPKRAFSSEQLVEFRRLVREKLPPAALSPTKWRAHVEAC